MASEFDKLILGQLENIRNHLDVLSAGRIAADIDIAKIQTQLTHIEKNQTTQQRWIVALCTASGFAGGSIQPLLGLVS